MWAVYTQTDDALGLPDFPAKLAARSSDFSALLDSLPGWAWNLIAWLVVAAYVLVALWLHRASIRRLLRRLPRIHLTRQVHYTQADLDKVRKDAEAAADDLMLEVQTEAERRVTAGAQALVLAREEWSGTEVRLYQEAADWRERFVQLVSEIEQLKKPGLEFRISDPVSRFRNPFDPDAEIVILEVHATGVRTVRATEVRIAECVPRTLDNGSFEFSTVEPLEVQRGAEWHSDVRPGRPLTSQILLIRYDRGRRLPDVRIYYANLPLIDRYPPLPNGIWDLRLVASSPDCPPAEQWMRLTVQDDPVDRIILVPRPE